MDFSGKNRIMLSPFFNLRIPHIVKSRPRVAHSLLTGIHLTSIKSLKLYAYSFAIPSAVSLPRCRLLLFYSLWLNLSILHTV